MQSGNQLLMVWRTLLQPSGGRVLQNTGVQLPENVSLSLGRKLGPHKEIPHFCYGTQSLSQCSYKSISVPHHQPIYPPINAQISFPEVTVYAYLVCATFTPFKIQLQCYTVKSNYNEFKHSTKMYYINLDFFTTDVGCVHQSEISVPARHFDIQMTMYHDIFL